MTGGFGYLAKINVLVLTFRSQHTKTVMMMMMNDTHYACHKMAKCEDSVTTQDPHLMEIKICLCL